MISFTGINRIWQYPFPNPDKINKVFSAPLTASMPFMLSFKMIFCLFIVYTILAVVAYLFYLNF